MGRSSASSGGRGSCSRRSARATRSIAPVRTSSTAAKSATSECTSRRAAGGALRTGRAGLSGRVARGRACRVALVSVSEGKRSVSRPTDLVQGHVDLLVLKILALEPRHGWSIAQRLKQVSNDVLKLNQGAL